MQPELLFHENYTLGISWPSCALRHSPGVNPAEPRVPHCALSPEVLLHCHCRSPHPQELLPLQPTPHTLLDQDAGVSQLV